MIALPPASALRFLNEVASTASVAVAPWKHLGLLGSKLLRLFHCDQHQVQAILLIVAKDSAIRVLFVELNHIFFSDHYLCLFELEDKQSYDLMQLLD
jgi:hypothetical protein